MASRDYSNRYKEKLNMRIAFSTNLPSHFHTRTFETIAEHYDTDFFFFSDGNESWIENKNEQRVGRYRGNYVKGIRITSRVRINTDLVTRLFKGHYDVFIQSINGRFELAATFIIARVLKKPFILWTNLWFHPQTLFHKITFPITRYIYRHADAIVAYGYHVKDYLIPLGVDERKISYSWNVTDNSLFNRPISESEKDVLKKRFNLQGRHILLFVGRLSEEKGLEYLLDGIRNLPRELKVSLLLVGKGESKSNLMRMVKKHSMDYVYFVDYVPNKELVPFYALADIFVLPPITTKTLKEVWGIVLNEAMNQGCPVIATTAVGAAMGGLVQQGKNGLIVPERDSQALANAIIEIFSNGEKLQRMKEYTREEIKKWDENKSFKGFDSAIKYVHAKTDSPKAII
jgi:glycosyltransferase involved in cell wall biosynthesis